MIVASAPSIGRIVREVSRPLAALFVWDVAVTVTYYLLPFRAPELPLTLFGSAVALFLGFRGNSAYARWWEGRVLWGALINSSRSLARAANALLDGEERRDLRRTIILRQIAFAHALRCHLRRVNPAPDVRRFLSAEEADEGLSRRNPPSGMMDGTGARIAEAERRGWIDSVQQAHFEGILVSITDAQGGMERLKNTPLPYQYRVFPALFARVLCVLLPVGLVETLGWATPVGSTVAGLMFLAILQIGDDLVDPFAGEVHDVPLAAMCRTIEIDLLQSIGEPAPEPLTPVRGVLW